MKERKEHIFLLRPSFLFIPNQKENDSQDRVVMADLTICVFSFPFLFLSSPYVSPYIVKRFQRLSPFLECTTYIFDNVPPFHADCLASIGTAQERSFMLYQDLPVDL